MSDELISREAKRIAFLDELTAVAVKAFPNHVGECPLGCSVGVSASIDEGYTVVECNDCTFAADASDYYQFALNHADLTAQVERLTKALDAAEAGLRDVFVQMRETGEGPDLTLARQFARQTIEAVAKIRSGE